MITNLVFFLFKKDLFSQIKATERSQYYSIDHIKNEQELKFINLINHARKNVPYYKDILTDIHKIDDLSKIPLLTKSIIKKEIKNLKAIDLNQNRFEQNDTSGSTGESLFFYSDSNNLLAKAVNIRSDSWAGLKHGSKGLYLWGAERDIVKSRSFYKKIKDRFFVKNKILSTYHISDSDILEYIKIFNKYKPSVSVSYPTPLFRVAQYIKENNLKVFSPKGVITSAETLFPFQREKIEEVFKCSVFNRYGSREFGSIAAECEFHNGMHINADNLLVEIVDPDGNICKPGEFGEIVITDLCNYVFPFIRYKIGDLGVLSDRTCECGRNLPLLERVEGRVFDLIVGSNGNMVGGTFWTLFRNKLKGWQKFQIIQEKHNSIQIVIEKNDKIESDFNEKIISMVREKLGEDMEIELNFVDAIPQTVTGKHRWIISKIFPYVK